MDNQVTLTFNTAEGRDSALRELWGRVARQPGTRTIVVDGDVADIHIKTLMQKGFGAEFHVAGSFRLQAQRGAA